VDKVVKHNYIIIIIIIIINVIVFDYFIHSLYTVVIQFVLLRMSSMPLETCWES